VFSTQHTKTFQEEEGKGTKKEKGSELLAVAVPLQKRTGKSRKL
jgi:hypothetical protein